jgi:hypothetical protein
VAPSKSFTLGRDGVEQRHRLLELALVVVVLAEEEVQLVSHGLEGRLVQLGPVVLADLVEDAGRVRHLARERGQPLQRLVVVGVGRPLRNDAIEVGQGRRVELQLVQRLAHPELGLLLVGLAVAGFALDDLVELDRGRVVVLAVIQLHRPFQDGRGRAAVAGWARFLLLCPGVSAGANSQDDGHQEEKSSHGS